MSQGDPVPLPFDTESNERRFANAIQQEVMQLVRGVSIPIIGADRRCVRQQGELIVIEGQPIAGYGSGTLYRRREDYFIVTAAHVVREFARKGLELRVVMGDRPKPIPMDEDLVSCDEASDVAAIKLTSDTLAQLENVQFLSASDIADDCDLSDWRCVLFGYTAQGSGPGSDFTQHTLRNFEYWTKQYPGVVPNDSYSAKIHFLLSFNCRSFDLSGVPIANPHLGGMSGCAVWRVFHLGQIDDGWQSESLRVVGLENLVYGDNNCIRCTKWECVDQLLSNFE